ncbi:substrate-binding domain-containing protein [Spirochaetales bacterium NM-380-WT-3C1]|uniref:Substrate-binding domain-containing protein n=1 Tax=Bullifex porci TaxID=2606638 RepID=A0A7X2PBH2_9SPIO|nr:substrate-binding domain-containing protein [Bullifex porci]MSU05806.1 substrate-binding domain-containing protein [Bullifex porci]
MLKYQIVKNTLLNKIQKMSPGDLFPTRKELLDELNVARATIDKAIGELCKDGVLVSKKGDGTYISDKTSGTNIESQNWGVIVPDITESIYSGIVRGAENYAQKVNANIILCNSDSKIEKQTMYLERLFSSDVKGIILVPVISNNISTTLELNKMLSKSHIPFVFCNRGVDGIDAPLIASNDFYGAYIATKHLLKQGYKSPAYISREKYKTSSDRCQGYLSALLEKNITVNRNSIIIKLQQGEEKDKIRNLFANKDIDSVFCFDDAIAEVCYDVAKEMGKSIPKDLGIIGYNNTARCNSLIPTLSSVSFRNVEIGEKAAEVLYKIIKSGLHSEFETYLFQPNIEARESTARDNSN